MKQRHHMHTTRGERTLARFDHDSSPTLASTVHWQSAGGSAQSRDYKDMLTALFFRAGKLGLILRRVAVETRTTGKLDLETRTCVAEPIDLSGLDEQGCDALRARIGTKSARVGRPAGARGGGNTTKALRLYFSEPLTATELSILTGEAKARAAA